VKFWLNYASTLSNGLQLAEEVSLHTADGVRKDQVAWLGIFRNHPIPQLLHQRRGNRQFAPFVLPPLTFEFEATVRLGTHPHDIDIIEKIAIFRIRHFLLTATRVQEIAHPQFFFGVCHLEKRLEFWRLVWLDLFFFVAQLTEDFSSEKDRIGTQKCVAGLKDVVNVTGLKQSVPGGLALPKEGYVRKDT
jgi:hypothetical protein